MDSPPPPSPSLPSPSPSPRLSSTLLCENSSPTLEQPLPTPSRRGRPRRKPVAAAAEAIEAGPNAPPRLRARKGRSRSAAVTRNPRKNRRRSEEEIVVEEKAVDPCEDDDLGRASKRKRGKEKMVSEEKPASVPIVPSSDSSPSETAVDDRRGAPDGPFERIFELLVWKNVAKSTLWFGFGSTFFLSSCFRTESSFSILSAMSHMGLWVLGIAFVKNTITKRQQYGTSRNLQLTEDDFLRAARFILPVVNATLTKIQDIFSGDPLRTLKVAPILLLGANYGHLLTLWRLLVTGFFLSFTVPKLYLCYSQQIHTTAESAIIWTQEAWKSCHHKRLVAASAAAIFWNLFSIRTRVFAAFIFLVMLCYRRQHTGEEESGKGSKEEKQQQASIVDEKLSSVMQLD
ncbi:reticulon-like protein B17 [Canna indica]|uniref:Reticulon-like protein n=1 Tax=Canna indica TaxID=4628 RepID=A0AAQ3QM12_9LILI|nr:reticulon-like protein B17 [Canna indica]